MLPITAPGLPSKGVDLELPCSKTSSVIVSYRKLNNGDTFLVLLSMTDDGFRPAGQARRPYVCPAHRCDRTEVQFQQHVDWEPFAGGHCSGRSVPLASAPSGACRRLP